MVFNPEKLSVKLIAPADFTQPIEGRRYTLTHSDITGELFLDIGYSYNDKAINWKMRDEVLAEWKLDQHGLLRLIGKAYIDGGEFDKNVSGIRFNIFKKEMDTALKGMIYGDYPFFAHFLPLLDAPIFINYDSIYPEYKQTVYYGTPRQYLSKIYQGSRLCIY